MIQPKIQDGVPDGNYGDTHYVKLDDPWGWSIGCFNEFGMFRGYKKFEDSYEPIKFTINKDNLHDYTWSEKIAEPDG